MVHEPMSYGGNPMANPLDMLAATKQARSMDEYVNNFSGTTYGKYRTRMSKIISQQPMGGNKGKNSIKEWYEHVWCDDTAKKLQRKITKGTKKPRSKSNYH